MIGVGAELAFAVDVAARLRNEQNLRVRVVSFPSHRLFEKQSLEYKRATLRRHTDTPAVVIEPYVALGWERYADAAVCMSTDRFGKSLPGQKAYEYFGYELGDLTSKVSAYLKQRNAGNVLAGEFVEM